MLEVVSLQSRVGVTRGGVTSGGVSTWVFPLLAAALGAGVQRHLLHHLQLLLHPREVEVCALHRHRGEVWGGTTRINTTQKD